MGLPAGRLYTRSRFALRHGLAMPTTTMLGLGAALRATIEKVVTARVAGTSGIIIIIIIIIVIATIATITTIIITAIVIIIVIIVIILNASGIAVGVPEVHGSVPVRQPSAGCCGV
jgi:hypothetical protein